MVSGFLQRFIQRMAYIATRLHLQVYNIRGGSRNLGRGGGGGHRKGVGAGGGCAPSRASRGSFEQYSNTDTHSL